MTAPWRNLGRWAPGRSYPDAQLALADAVADAAGSLEGKTVVELGCGAGAGLVRWLEHHGAERAIGYDPQAQPRLRRPGVEQVRARACELSHAADVVLAVDAAYHFDLPRTFAAVRRQLRPGGAFAFTDLLLDSARARTRAAAWAMGRVCRLGPGAPRTEADLRALAAQYDLHLSGARDLTIEVLGGFAGFVRGQPDIPPRDRLPFHLTASFAAWAVATRAVRYACITARAR